MNNISDIINIDHQIGCNILGVKGEKGWKCLNMTHIMYFYATTRCKNCHSFVCNLCYCNLFKKCAICVNNKIKISKCEICKIDMEQNICRSCAKSLTRCGNFECSNNIPIYLCNKCKQN